MTNFEQRIDDLLAQMTLEDKIALIHAGSKFAIGPNPRLGIPEFWMSDGPHGVRQEIGRDSWDPVDTEEDRSTYLPTGTAAASTWNPELGRKFGEVLGAEARARGKDVILGPGINIVRTPLCGRNFEYYGEDPFHIARMVVPVVEGIQSQGVAACVKHYAANNQELNRTKVDAQMDERTLREIYLPGFKAAVVEGKCLTVMGAYNKFRGQYCCHNEHLVNGILKGEWGFDGCFISDWAGVTSTAEAAKYGLDLEMGTSSSYDDYFLARPFREAIQRGELDVALLNDKVRRNLRVMFRVGIFDAGRAPGERNTPGHQQAALEIARETIVLLKNDGAVLPLDQAALRRLVVIGENATIRHAEGGFSSGVKAFYEVTPLEGLRNRLGDSVEICYFQGYPARGKDIESIKTEYLGMADEGAGTRGWKALYYANRDFQGEPVPKAEVAIDFDWADSSPLPGCAPGQYAVRWETTLTPPQSGIYEFVLLGALHATFFIDGSPVTLRFDGGSETIYKSVELEAGRSYQLKVELRPIHSRVRIKLGWIPAWLKQERPSDDDLIEAVKNSDAVLFFGGLNHQYDTEAADRRDMQLHEGQNELIERIAGLNPRTAVVMISGSPVEMPWAGKIPAIVQAWYAGMEAGNAIADILLGQVNPSGKLAMTFPKRLEDSPAHALSDYDADVCRYAEQIFVGYRWFDARGIEPLFPFGHGLSYTTFALSNLQLERQGDGVRVSIDVANTGARAGAEVVQIYVGQPGCSVERPVRELKGFAKVALQPGKTKRIEIELAGDAFAFWSVEKNGWTVEPGEFVIEAGVSSRQIAATDTIILPA
jgi:beta-glucosidase